MPSWYFAGNERRMGPGPNSVASGPPFTPASLSGLLAWYEADLDVYTTTGGSTPSTNGSAAAQWRDQTGTSNNTLITGDGAPTYTTSFNGSKSGVVFAAASTTSMLQQFANTFVMGTGTTGSWFVLMQIATGSATARIMDYHATGQANDFDNGGSAALTYDTTPFIKVFRNFGTFPQNAQTVATNTPTCVGTVFDGTASGMATPYVNFTAGTPAAQTDAWGSPGSINIGNRLNHNDQYIDGTYAAIVITSSAMSGTDITNLRNYWNTKYGLSL